MNVLKENKAYIILLFLNFLLILNVIEKSYLITDFSYLFTAAVLIVSVIAYFFYDFVLRKLIYKLLFIFLLLTITLFCLFYSGKGYYLYYDLVNKITAINYAVGNGTATYFIQYREIMLIALPLLVFAALAFANKGITDMLFVLTLSVMVTFWYIGFYEVVKAFIFKFIFVGIITLGVNNSVRSIRKLKKHNLNLRFNSFKILLCMLMPALVISFVITKLPQSFEGKYDETINSVFINNYAKPITTNTDKLVSNKYSLDVSGYDGNKKKLGGPISINNKLIMKVKADAPVYLRGSVKEYYSGFAWSSSVREYDQKQKDTVSMLRPSTGLSDFLYNSSTLIIYPQVNETSSLFAPSYTYNIRPDKGNVFFDFIPTFITDNSNVKKYYVDYYNMAETSNFEQSMSMPWLAALGTYLDNEALESKYNSYLQVPSNISKRTSDLLKDITNGSMTRYGKIAAIKAYLDKNYKYSLDVSTVPDNQEFLDYFLFTEKKGYCVYFATAATIMCRMEGIPARYVEGYKVSGNKDSNGLYNVTNEDAHAWCEVLIDPDKNLWATLETTPSAVEVSTTQPSQVQTTQQNNNSNPANSSNPRQRNLRDINSNTTHGTQSTVKVPVLLIALCIIFVIIFGRFAFGLVRKKKLLNDNSIMPFYKYCIKRLKQVGVSRPEALGDLEYANTIYDNEAKRIYSEIAVRAYAEFYGKKPVKDFDRRKLYHEIEVYIKNNQNLVIYLIKKYIFL